MEASVSCAAPAEEHRLLAEELDAAAVDGTTLSAALAYLDDCGLGNLTDTEVVDVDQAQCQDARGDATRTPPPAVTTSLPTQTTKKKKKPYSKRQREELDFLRSTVSELEQELLNLKRQAEATPVQSVVATNSVISGWEDIAARQSEQRQRTEQENARLRMLVEEQLQVAKSFERLLKKRNISEFADSPPTRGTYPTRVQIKPDVCISAFEELTDVVDRMYFEADTILSHDHFASKSLPFRNIHVRENDQLETVVEAFDVRITPFELYALANATWQQMAAYTNPHETRSLEVTHDQFSREFVMALDAPRLQGTFDGKVVARRHIEEGRVVLVWATRLSPTMLTSDEQGLYMRGYTILTKAASSLGGQSATLTRTCLIFQPQRDDESRSHVYHKVGTMTNFVLNSVRLHMDEDRQMIENMVLESSGKTAWNPDAVFANCLSL